MPTLQGTRYWTELFNKYLTNIQQPYLTNSLKKKTFQIEMAMMSVAS